MADINQTIRNGLAVGGVHPPIARNADGVYTGRQNPYFGFPQNRIANLYGKYATDYYSADLQGYDPEDFYRYWPVKIRCMDVTRETTGSNLSDDIKAMVVCEPEGVNYVPLGAHVRFARNTWLVTNPSNIAAIMSDTIIRRCNAVYRRLDFYGNVLECPFNIPKVTPRGAQDDYTKNMILADHYFTCAMQLNAISATIRENTRLILGDAAYSIRGLDNFTQEFTDPTDPAPLPSGGGIIINGDHEIHLGGAVYTDDGSGNIRISTQGSGGSNGLSPDAVHIIYFQIQREEKVSVYDDMERKIADGLAFSWDISLTASVSMHQGQSQTIGAASVRNGVAVESTEENPVSYRWSTSDPAVLAVDGNGTVTAAGEGTATITCTLAQNTGITESVEISVTAGEGAYVAFDGALPDSLAEQESVTISASLYLDGQKTDEPVRFSFSGPSGGEFSAETDGEENEITVTCWERSDTPLTITAAYGEHTARHTISLEAW